jgi:class 3 adenylate cyclase
MHYEFDKKEALAKAEQEKKDALALEEIENQKFVRNGFMGGFAAVLVFAGTFFIQRNKIKKGNRRSDELLLNILPEEVAEELKETGASKARAFNMVSVMFTDFKDFTKISETVSAEMLVDELHTCFSAFDTILHKHNIEKIKTIGDAYMCVSGLPVANDNHATDMVKAAMEILDYMTARKKEKDAKGEFSFELRIGINSGPVIAGIVGLKKFSYDIWGDTVNTAARIENHGEAGKINISGSTYELVKDNFRCEHRGKITAKNKGEIDMYFVSRSYSEPERI